MNRSNMTGETIAEKRNLSKYYFYGLFSHLFFERGIFIIYLGYKGLSIPQISLFQGIINAAMMVAEIPTGIIADRIGKKHSLLLVAGALMQFVGILVPLFLPNIVYEVAASKRQIFAVIDNLKQDTVLVGIAVFLGINVGMVSASYILGQQILFDSGMPTQYISLFFFADNIIAMLAFSQVESIMRFFGQKKSVVACFIMMTAGFVFLPSNTLWLSATAILVISITSNYTSTVFMDCFYSRIEDSVRAMGGGG